MICKQCGKDLTNSIKVMGLEATLFIHDKAHMRETIAALADALRAILRAPVTESGRPGSVTIELQTFNLKAAREALAKVPEK